MQQGMAVAIAAQFYGTLTVVSASWLVYRHGFGYFRPPALAPLVPWLAQSLAVAGLIVLLSRLIADGPWAKAFEREFHRAMGPLDRRETFLLAVFSGIGEEIFFRGVLQPILGLWVATIVFGLVHVPYNATMRPWTAFALLMGLYLGYLFQASGSLWPPILLHFVVNDQNLTFLARRRPPSNSIPGGEVLDEDRV